MNRYRVRSVTHCSCKISFQVGKTNALMKMSSKVSRDCGSDINSDQVTEFCARAPPTTPCNGDSGSPAVLLASNKVI